MTPLPLIIIGIGNDWRGDDAAGLLAARALRKLNLPNVTITEHGGDGASLMQTWAGAAVVILIDAVSAGGNPGTIYRIDANHETTAPDSFSTSSHLLGVGEAVELARALGQLPPRLVIFGIEGRDFAVNAALSPAVAANLPVLVERIVQEILNGTNDRLSL
ncbi:MAG: hydrogenase maturation protease [Chloroflexi bacterium]|nr:hydrogenase maturation protease [Chloroflexota bacterium]